ncbi:hypothetical protein SAMN06296273_0188 [Nitrosomonas ureae]|uniref:Uncharacterized protein n=1 Tax=Nitrosomonas ureae TaxID=44577 RepID=A0A285BUF8_9PROT|nr:hypothetical protein SAMN06296273_0188 [Nitrosomonas ureae]
MLCNLSIELRSLLIRFLEGIASVAAAGQFIQKLY